MEPNEINEEYVQRRNRRELLKAFDTLSIKDHKLYTFAPLVITEVGWRYAQKCAEYCSENRLDNYKKNSRLLATTRREYERVLRERLGAKCVADLTDRVELWLEECSKTLTVLYFESTNQVLKCNSNERHPYMKATAWVGLVVLDLLAKVIKEGDEVLGTKLRKAMHTEVDSTTLTLIDILVTYAERAIVEPITFLNSLKIMYKKLEDIVFLASPALDKITVNPK